MQVRQLHALGAAQSAYRVLTANPPLVPLTNMSATFTQQVQTLGSLISQIESQASAQTSARSALTDKASAANTLAKELRSAYLVPLRKMAKLITKGNANGTVTSATTATSNGSGGTVSTDVPVSITIPDENNYQALIAAANAAVTNVTPYKDLFIAHGMASDFLDQITAQITALTQALQAVKDAKSQRVGTTAGLAQLLKSVRSTIQLLDVAVQRACKADRVNGPAARTTWETAKNVRKAPVPTDVPWPPTTAKTTTTAVSPVSSPAVSVAPVSQPTS